MSINISNYSLDELKGFFSGFDCDYNYSGIIIDNKTSFLIYIPNVELFSLRCNMCIDIKYINNEELGIVYDEEW